MYTILVEAYQMFVFLFELLGYAHIFIYLNSKITAVEQTIWLARSLSVLI